MHPSMIREPLPAPGRMPSSIGNCAQSDAAIQRRIFTEDVDQLYVVLQNMLYPRISEIFFFYGC